MKESVQFEHRFKVPSGAIDANGHVNNVSYVQWMQDVAIRHSEAVGGMEKTVKDGATWVVRTHRVEYLSPAFLGEEIRALTWVENIRRVRSVRRYEFRRADDDKLLARGETDWVYIDASTGHPRAIPEAVAECYLPGKPELCHHTADAS